MQVFKIFQKSNQSEGTIEEKKVEAIEVQGAPAESGVKPEVEEGILRPIEDASSPAEQKPADEKDEKPVHYVKIDGPVSRAYTEALRKVLAMESYMTVSPVDPQKYTEAQTHEKAGTQMIDIVCLDAEAVSYGDVATLTNEISQHGDHEHVIVLESAAGRFSDASASLLRLAKLPKVTLVYGQTAMMDHVGKLLK